MVGSTHVYPSFGCGVVRPTGCARVLYSDAPWVPVEGGYKLGGRGEGSPKSLLDD
jgi:hypothetical protein